MKKHLIAIAVASAVAVPAMAQNVTLFGQIDAGAAHIQGAGTAAARSNGQMYTDGSMSSSIWGIRGTEDLGGGLRALFYAESDLFSNNGTTASAGLWRRGAYTGLAGGFGDVTFGIRTNPLIATNGALMPMAGNSVSTLLATALSYQNFYTRNAITYTTPNINGLVGQFQYGMANSFTNSAPGGNVAAASFNYTQGGLVLRGAAHNRTANGTTSGANVTQGSISADPTIDQAARAAVLGAQYSIGAWSVAVAMVENSEQPSAGATKVKRTGNQVGAAYQASSALRLGGSFTRAEGSELLNLQARYSLSKRTTAYAQFGQATNNTNTVTTKQVSFGPLANNTNNQSGVIASGLSALSGAKQQGYGVGLIHAF